MKKKPDKPFEAWLYEEINHEFGLKLSRKHPVLTQFEQLSVDKNISQAPAIAQYAQDLLDRGDSWNEDELKFFFISPFIALVSYKSDYYNSFTQRPLSVHYDNGNKITSGRVEFMLARGIQIPQKPHFFIHEYKPAKRRESDPLGQLLIAMVAAQVQNEDNLPIYGVYVVGRFWYFVILENKEYAISYPYDAANPDTVFHLFAILQYIKTLMDKLYAPSEGSFDRK